MPHTYGQYCPIALGAEVFAERWTPIILRNLMMGCTRFGDLLDGAPGLSRSVLCERLRRLEREGVVERAGSGHRSSYRLTPCGRELADVCVALGVWGARWREVTPEHQDPYLALWGITRLVDPASLPQRRVVVRFDLTDGRRPDRYWLVLGESGNEVCVDPVLPEDGVVSTDADTIVRWVSGRTTTARAQRAGTMAVSAPRWLRAELNTWGRLSLFADVAPV
jgi:DNA-binding HxlR family transcriptional regulator